MKLRALLIVLFFLGSTVVMAQGYATKDNPAIRKQKDLAMLLKRVEGAMANINIDVRRLSVVSFNYPDYILTENEAGLIRNEIEGLFSNYGFSVISAPEFKIRTLTTVSGTDSNLQIIRQNQLDRLMTNPDELSKIVARYGIQAFVYCQLTYDFVIGYKMNIQIVKSFTKEMVWNETFTSAPENMYESSFQSHLGIGLGLFEAKEYILNDDVYPNGTIGGMLDFSLSMRQPFTKKRGGYYGFTLGVQYFQLLPYVRDSTFEEFKKFIPHGGLRYSICFLSKQEGVNEYWFEGYQSLNIMVTSSLIPYVRQGFVINSTKNLSLELDVRYLLVDSEISTNFNSVKLNQFGYGFSLLYKL